MPWRAVSHYGPAGARPAGRTEAVVSAQLMRANRHAFASGDWQVLIDKDILKLSTVDPYVCGKKMVHASMTWTRVGTS